MATSANPTIKEAIESASDMYDQNEIKAMNKSEESPADFIFYEEEAGIVVKFFEEELLRIENDLGSQTSREPAFGQPEKVTITSMKEKHLKVLQRSIEKIRNDLQQYHKQYVKYESGHMETDVEEFVKRSRGNSSTLIYLDTRNKQVCVAGTIYDQVRSEVHKLKVQLGIIKMTKRRTRSTLSVASDVDTIPTTSRPVPLGPDVSDDSNRSIRHHVKEITDSTADISIFYVTETLNRSLELKVYKASILELNVDVIVCPANGSLVHGAGAARVIADAAGDELEGEIKEYIKTNGQLMVTQNCVTTAGRLRRYKGIIHAVGPEWKMYSYNKVECLDDLYDTVTNVLQLCAAMRYDYVAMPPISAGIFGVPKRFCADMYIKAVADFSKTQKLYPRELHIVDIDTEILGLIKDSFERWNENKSSIDQRRTVPVCFKIGDTANRVVIYNGSIDRVGYVDALVCAINKNLYPGGPTATALLQAGGHSYTDALRDMRKDNYGKKRNKGDVVVSKGGGLKVPNVIHLVMQGGYSEKDLPVFKTNMRNVLEEAERTYFRAIALPLIGTGGILNNDVLVILCDALVETICAFFAKRLECCVKEIHLVNKSPQVCTALNTAFANMVDKTPAHIRRDRPIC